MKFDHSLRHWQLIAWLLILVFFSNATYLIFSDISAGVLAGKAADSQSYLVFMTLTYLLVFILSIARYGHAWRVIISNSLLLPIGLTGIASFLWNGYEQISLLRFFMYLATLATGALLASYFRPVQLWRLLIPLLLIACATSIFVIPLMWGKFSYDGSDRQSILGLPAYSGAFSHKNTAGTFFALSISALYASRRLLGSNRATTLAVTVSVILLLLSGAIGPLIALLSSIVIVYLKESSHSWASFLLKTSIYLVSPAVLMHFFGDSILAIFNRDRGLTGRGFLFEVWPDFFWGNWPLGYGYNGFFTGVQGDFGETLSNMSTDQQVYYTFESSYLEIGIQLGFAGYLVFGLAAHRLWKQISSTQLGSIESSVILALTSTLLIGSLTDTYLLLHNYISAVFLGYIFSYISNASSQQTLVGLAREVNE